MSWRYCSLTTEQEEVMTMAGLHQRGTILIQIQNCSSINQSDCEGELNDPFICLNFQKSIERKAWVLAGKTQRVPAQRLKDFMDGKLSVDFPKSSYHPGLTSVKMDDVFPLFIVNKLKKAFIEFDKKMKGFMQMTRFFMLLNQNFITCLNTRNNDTLEHPGVKGLYPCGEGAGFAGGIVSCYGYIKVMDCNHKIKKAL